MSDRLDEIKADEEWAFLIRRFPDSDIAWLVAEVERLRGIVAAYVDDGLTAAHARLAAARTVAAEAEEA